MSEIRYILPIALLASLFISLAPQPAAAAGMPGQHGITCADGVCTLTIDLDGDFDVHTNGELQTEAFIPFDDVLDDVYVQLDGRAAIPLANIDMRKTARLDTDKVVAWMEPVEGIVAEWVDAAPAIDWNAP